MIYGTLNLDVGPNQSVNGPNGSFFNRVLKPVAIKAGADAKAAASQATVNAIKKLAQKPTATMPDVTPVSASPDAPATPWLKYALYGVAGLVVLKLISGGSGD